MAEVEASIAKVGGLVAKCKIKHKMLTARVATIESLSHIMDNQLSEMKEGGRAAFFLRPL